MKMRSLCALLLSIACVSGGTQAQTPLGQDVNGAMMHEVRQSLRTLYGDLNFVRGYVAKNIPMFSDEQGEKMAVHLKVLLTNDKTIDRIISYAKPALQAKLTKAQMASYYAEVGMTIGVKGVGRLSDDDLMYFIGTVVDMHRQVSAELCKQR